MKRKILCALLAATMAVSMTACGGGNAGGGSGTPGASDAADAELTDDNITLKYWHYEDQELIEMMAEGFMKEHPNITVEVRRIDDMSTDLSAAAAAQDFPDVFQGTDSDTALANFYWRDISEYYDADPETKNLMSSINTDGIGCFATSARFAVPGYYQPNAFYIDRNVVNKLNLTMPSSDWTWNEMIDLVKAATVDDRSGMKYYGMSCSEVRLDSVYHNLPMKVKGEFGFDGKTFDLTDWAAVEQEQADLKVGGYVCPAPDTQEMEDWSGDWGTWYGATGHVAVFSSTLQMYLTYWGSEGYQEAIGTDIVPMPMPKRDEDTFHTMATMYMAGVSSSCKYPHEAYELLKWMTYGKDGWMYRLNNIYSDKSLTNSAGIPYINAYTIAPITEDTEVWDKYKALITEGMDDDHKAYWDAYFDSIHYPTCGGWISIAGYWNFCDQYFNNIGIHDIVDKGLGKAADYVEEANRQANYYHAEAMLNYFGSDGYDVLSEEEINEYQAIIDQGL